jgi:hypothetical protein
MSAMSRDFAWAANALHSAGCTVEWMAMQLPAGMAGIRASHTCRTPASSTTHTAQYSTCAPSAAMLSAMIAGVPSKGTSDSGRRAHNTTS